MRFNFRVRFEPNELNKVRDSLANVMRELSERDKGKIKLSPPKWTEDNCLGSVDVCFNERDYRIDMQIDKEFEQDFEEVQKETPLVSEGISFTIEVDFPFKFLEPVLFSLNTLTNLLNGLLEENFYNAKFSKGVFTVAPIKADLTMDNWIKDKQFEVSLVLKAKQNISINLYSKKAEIIFPNLQIDENVYEYLKATILNYYL
jgi:hypothetical protein